MRVIILLLAIFAPLHAIADQLDDAEAICAKHLSGRAIVTLPGGAQFKSRGPEYPPEWAHCVDIDNAYTTRIEQKKDADESANPELKSTRELSRKLSK